MHLDSWENATPDLRELSSNRISVNIGNVPRYFLFYSISLREMWCQIRFQKGIMVEDLHEIPPVFMSHFSSFPVTRIRLDPGEAYVAPTEMIVHDGSTLGNSSEGGSFVSTGKFLVGA